MDDADDSFDDFADTEAEVECPYCGEVAEVALDPSGGRVQQYVEDCPVCCQAWTMSVVWDEDGIAQVSAATLDD